MSGGKPGRDRSALNSGYNDGVGISAGRTLARSAANRQASPWLRPARQPEIATRRRSFATTRDR
jgi:hypothetical protein